MMRFLDIILTKAQLCYKILAFSTMDWYIANIFLAVINRIIQSIITVEEASVEHQGTNRSITEDRSKSQRASRRKIQNFLSFEFG